MLKAETRDIIAEKITSGEIWRALRRETGEALISPGREILRRTVQTLIQARYNGTLADGEIESVAERCLGPATLARIFADLALRGPQGTLRQSQMVLALIGEIDSGLANRVGQEANHEMN